MTAASASSSDEEMKEMDGTLSHEEYERLKRLHKEWLKRVVLVTPMKQHADECDLLKILCCKCFVCLVNYTYVQVAVIRTCNYSQYIADNFRGVKNSIYPTKITVTHPMQCT